MMLSYFDLGYEPLWGTGSTLSFIVLFRSFQSKKKLLQRARKLITLAHLHLLSIEL